MNATMRRIIPLSARQELKHLQRTLTDYKNQIKFTKTTADLTNTHHIQITQPIRHSNFYENKLINIKRGCELLAYGSLEADQYWSFWHSLGRPNTANGFAKGRNLVNGELSAQIGGGLCQLSSMIYHLALIVGLKIIERHPHSIDIYEEHVRFTPLGADATVVWGVKDLRLMNPYPFPIIFYFKVENSELIGAIHSTHPIEPCAVEFQRLPLKENFNQVNTRVNGVLVTTNYYEHKPV